MKLNIRTPETSSETEHVGLRLYSDTVKELDEMATKLNVKRSVLIRHAIHEMLDAQEIIDEDT